MMKYYLIILSLIFVQCSNTAEHYNKKAASQASSERLANAKEEDQSNQASASLNDHIDYKKIIKSGNIKIEVEDLSVAKKNIDSLVEQSNAYYENQEYTSNTHRNSYFLNIRIPNTAFDSLCYSLEKALPNVVSKYIQAQDVSEEYIDLGIRLDNKLNYLKQYNMILKKATTIAEILEVKERIRGLELEIDRTKGRLNLLDSKVKYSTLHLEVFQKNESNNPNNKIGIRISDSFTIGLDLFIDFILLFVKLWPFVISLILVLSLRKKIFTFINRKPNSND